MSRFEDIYPLFHQYDMYAQTIELLKEPNVYKVMTPYGSFVCKRTKALPARIEIIGGILRELEQRGWDGAIPFTYTKFDEPYVQRGAYLYYVTPWQGADRPATQSEEWSQTLVRRLAELHHLTQNYRFDNPRQVEPLVQALNVKWQGWLDQTEIFARIAEQRTYPSPFDVVFLANHAFISERAQVALEQLERWQEAHRAHNHFRLSINHGFPHPAHLVADRAGRFRLINFDRSQFDTPMRDVTLFYRTFFHLGGDEDEASLLLSSYQQIFPIRPDEMELLHTFLIFPERIMRDLDAYYNQKVAWQELYAVRRLEKDIDRLYRLSRWCETAFQK